MSREKELSIGGKVYRLCTVDARGFAELQERFRESTPCPVKQLVDTASLLPEGMREGYIKENIAEAAKLKAQQVSLDSPAFRAWLATLDGATVAYSLMFRKHHPDMTEGDAMQVVLEGFEEHGEAVFSKLFPQELAAAPNSRGSRKAVSAK